MFQDLVKKKKTRTCITFDSDLLMELNIKVAKKEIKSVSCYIEELVLKDKAKLEKLGTKRHSNDNIDDLADL